MYLIVYTCYRIQYMFKWVYEMDISGKYVTIRAFQNEILRKAWGYNSLTLSEQWQENHDIWIKEKHYDIWSCRPTNFCIHGTSVS